MAKKKKAAGEKSASKSGGEWKAELAAVKDPAPKLGMPLVEFLREVLGLVRLVEKYWEPEREEGSGKLLRPGLRSAVKKDGQKPAFTAKLGEELRSLHDEVQAAQTAYLLGAKPDEKLADRVARGSFLLGELTAALEWAFDDGVEDEHDAQLAALAAAHQDTHSVTELASALRDYGALAKSQLERLDGVLDFDPKYVKEAQDLSILLESAPASAPPAGTHGDEKTRLRRDGLLVLLLARVSLLRRAAGLVFRAHPTVARKFGSAYRRRSRAEQRRKKSAPTPATG